MRTNDSPAEECRRDAQAHEDAAAKKSADGPQTIRYHVTLIDDRGGFRSDAIATTVGGNVVSTTQRFDAEGHDLALFDIPEDAEEYMDSLLEDDENVVGYRVR